MQFALGIIVGLLIAILIVATIAVFRKAIEKHIKTVERVLGEVGPQPRGFIIEPTSDADEAREEIIRNNRKHGKDTPISELQ